MIQPANWTADQSKVTLGALRAIATLHGTAEMSTQEKELLEGIRINILRHPELTEADENVHVKNDDLVNALQDDEHRVRACQLIALMPYATRPFSDSKTFISERMLEALGENMHRMEDFLGARQKHSKNMEYCMLRKMGRDILRSPDPQLVSAELQKMLADSEGSPEERARYESLKDYPAGSLGRAFWDFYAQFDWPLPGDPLWISEELTVRHDIVHILCDYDISIDGEFQVSGFTAGNSATFNWMIAMLGFTPPYVSTGEQCNPKAFIDAYERGANASKSFIDAEWDFWPEMKVQVADLRSNYNLI